MIALLTATPAANPPLLTKNSLRLVEQGVGGVEWEGVFDGWGWLVMASAFPVGGRGVWPHVMWGYIKVMCTTRDLPMG
jgi:hypothetical protein